MHEREITKPKRANKIVAGVGELMVGLFFVATPVLGFLGYRQGVQVESRDNLAKNEEAAGLEECVTFAKENDKLPLVLSGIPRELREACSVTDAIEHDSSLVVSEDAVIVNLPQVDVLEARIAELQHDANDFDLSVPIKHSVAFGAIGCGFALAGYFIDKEA